MTRRGFLVCAGMAALGLGHARALADWAHGAVRQQLGPPRAPHAMPGVDAARSRRSSTVLAQPPRVERRLRALYGVGRGLVTRDDGGFFILHESARASRFDAQGKLVYSLRLPAEPASAPVVTSGGDYAFVAGGELHLTDDLGRTRSRTPLGDADFVARSILASRDGGVALASSGAVLKISALGELVFRRTLAETPLELLETPAGLLCVTAPGSVYRLDPTGRSSKLGELGSTTQAVTSSRDDAFLLARTGNHRWVVFDTSQHRLRATVEDASLELDGPVLLGADHIAQIFTADGLLIRYRVDGSEAERVIFDPGARKAPGANDALLLGDGRLLVARAGADVTIITPGGEVATVPSSACPDPVGIFPAGPRAALVACRSGNIQRLE
jgi:hypothetical protein